MLRTVTTLLGLIILSTGNGYAGVKLISKDTPSKSALTKLREKTPISSFVIKQSPLNTKPMNSEVKFIKNEWHELYGYLNKNYVYLLVEKIGDRQIAGYLFDNKGMGEYVYGEWFKGYLQVYDQSHNNWIITINE